jgi:hypothetical protein
MLRRTGEHPESLDMDELPEWFKSAILKLTDMVEKQHR